MAGTGTDAVEAVAEATGIPPISRAEYRSRMRAPVNVAADYVLNVNANLHLHLASCQAKSFRPAIKEDYGQKFTRSAASPQPRIPAQAVESRRGSARATRSRGHHDSPHRAARGIDAGGGLSPLSRQGRVARDGDPRHPRASARE